MAKNWREIRAEAVAKELIDDKQAAEHRSRLEGAVRAHRLAEVRKAQGVSQKDIADAMGISQPRISKIERGDIANSELRTLRSYIEALGGRLRVVADFGDTQFVVGGADLLSRSDDAVPVSEPAMPSRHAGRRKARRQREDPSTGTQR